MDKRSWPWRKKTTDRSVSPNESLESSVSFPSSSRHIDHQDISNSLPDHHSRTTDDESTHWQDYEEKIKVLNDKLSAALMDAASKERLAKQHAKLAEEAVSGWETVEAEAALMKQQLEATIQQKLAAEDRVSHLDGALKECMRQLRNVREEQEENIHNAIVKKTREWDKVQCELEERMSDLEQKFLEKDAENKAMARSLGERARTISQMNDAYAKAQAEISKLQVRLESSEKDKVALKYELSVAHKEIEIRTEENTLSKKAADATSKQHLEDVKKIAKLEAECQRLRSLIRKKLPGPAAIAQMKLEVEGLWNERNDIRKKGSKGNILSGDSLMQSMQEFTVEDKVEGLRNERSDIRKKGSKGNTLSGVSLMQSMQEFTVEDNNQVKQGGTWLDRYSSLEEETKLLREILAKRNNELQSARLMCARTASKLSAVELQLEALKSNEEGQSIPVVSGLETHVEKSLSNSGEPSLASVSEDGNDGEVSCSESWATALIAELDQFKKGKLMPATDGSVTMSKLETDEFTELEQLVSSSPCDKSSSRQLNLWDDKEEAVTGDIAFKSTDENFLKEAEIQDACKLCEQFCTKLAAAEMEVAKTAADQTSLADLKKKLTHLFEEGTSVYAILEQIRADLGLPGDAHKGCGAGNSNALPANADPMSMQGMSSCPLASDSALHGVVELTTAVCKVALLVRDFATVTNTENPVSASISGLLTSDSTVAQTASYGNNLVPFDDMQSKADALDARCQNLTVMSTNVVNGNADLPQLIAELSSVLYHISSLRLTHTITSRFCAKRNLSLKSYGSTSGEIESIGVGSPMSDTSKSESSEAAAKIVPADDSIQSFRKDCFSSEVLRLEEELRKAQVERLALETHMKEDNRRIGELEDELFQLKLVKEEMEGCSVKDKDEIERLREVTYETEKRLGSLHAQLTSAESTKQLGEKQLSDMAAAKEELESKVGACKMELIDLHHELNTLAKELLLKEEKNAELEAKCNELQKELDMRSGLSCPQCSTAAGKDDQLCRELEIAAASEKLAECERTMLVLGQQLKALASPKGSPYQAVQSSPSLNQPPSDLRHVASSRYSSTSHDNTWEVGSNSARFSEPRDCERIKNNCLWDPRESIASDILDSELISLSRPGQQTSGRKMFDIFGDRVPVHEDYIEAVAQMPSSPETEPILRKVETKRPHRKKKSPRSFAGVDMSKSMNDACSPSAEKHASSFSRFFSRTRSSH